MKTIAILITIGMTLSSFTHKPTLQADDATSSEKLAVQIIDALKTNSSEQYAALFPSLPEFHQLMEKNAVVYGKFLREAQLEFSAQYQDNLLPEVNRSFEAIIAEGKSKGIDWSTIEFVRVENEVAKGFLPTIPVTLKFRSNGTEYTLQVERVLIIGDQYKISQYIKFV
jgi:hypothetical protein